MADKRPLTIRAESMVLDKLKVIAAENKRSLNAEIELSLEKTVKKYETEYGEIQLNEE